MSVMNQISSKIVKNYPVLNVTKRTLKMVSNPIETSIREKLSSQFNPKHLEVINESPMHNVPKGSESHFKVLVVSEKFMNVPLIMRHRMVNDALRDELTQGLHALSIQAKTPDQWKPSDVVEPSPNCRGGFGK